MPSENKFNEVDSDPGAIGDKLFYEQAGNTESVNLLVSFDAVTDPSHELAGTESEGLTVEERDALGEVGNICMGSAATTLSMLTGQTVNITSPQVNLTKLGVLFKSFGIPHLAIYVRFIEGLSGYNLLIMQLDDAAVLADLMMGGDGTNVTEGLTEIGVSAASEAMNQMIGSASTAMATMFRKTVNIAPPDTKIYYSSDEPRPPDLDHEGTVVVVKFKITVGSVLNTHIIQVMGVETAREQAGALLSQLSAGRGGEAAKERVSGTSQEKIGGSDDFVIASEEQNIMGSFDEEMPQKEFIQPAAVSQDPGFISTAELEARPLPTAGRQPGGVPPAAASSAPNKQHLDLILDIPLKVSVLLGRTKWPIKDILEVAPGSVVELQNQVDDPVEVLVNGTLVAMGEVVIVNENFGVRITNIVGPEDRLKYLRK